MLKKKKKETQNAYCREFVKQTYNSNCNEDRKGKKTKA